MKTRYLMFLVYFSTFFVFNGTKSMIESDQEVKILNSIVDSIIEDENQVDVAKTQKNSKITEKEDSSANLKSISPKSKQANYFKEFSLEMLENKKMNQKNINDDLSKERIENIVILNDILESYWQNNQNIFSKNNDDVLIFTLNINLITALLEKQTVICTKSLFKNIRYLVILFEDLIKLNASDFRSKYKELVSDLEDDELNKLSTIANESLYASFDIDKENMSVDSESNNYAQQDFFVNMHKFNDLFSIFKAYQIITQNFGYEVYDINDDYLLFFPNSKFEKFPKVSNEYLKIYLGLNILNYHHVPLFKADSLVDRYELHSNLDLGKSLQDAIKKIFINKQEFKKNESYKTKFLLPRFNIFINGHGDLSSEFLGMDQSYIRPLFKLLNDYLWMKSLIIVSCFPGGHHSQERFGNSLKSLDQSTQYLNYTILVLGSFFSKVYTPGFSLDFKDYKNNPKEKFYSIIFDHVSLFKNEYHEALDFMKNVVNNWVNYGSIKFPNTGWIMASDYNKDVFNISRTTTLSNINKGNIHIPASKKIILLNTSLIPLELYIDSEIDFLNIDKACLPINYQDLNYYINKLHLTIKRNKDRDFFTDHDVSYVLAELFKVKNLDIKERFNVIIEELILMYDGKEYKIFNIWIDFLNKYIYFSSGTEEEPLFYCHQLLDDSLVGVNNQYQHIFLRIKSSLFNNDYKIFKDFEFIQKLEKLPQGLEELPEKVRRSRWIYETEEKLKKLSKEKVSFGRYLSDQVASFTPQAKDVKAIAKAQPKRITHNPYAKIVNQPKAVAKDKRNQSPILSTFDPKENPYAKQQSLTN